MKDPLMLFDLKKSNTIAYFVFQGVLNLNTVWHENLTVIKFYGLSKSLK